MKENEKIKFKQLKKDLKRFEKAFYIMYCYFDSISDEEKPKVDKQLKRLGL